MHTNIYISTYIYILLPHLIKEMVIFTDDKNKHKYIEIENKFAKHCNIHILALITCNIEKENFIFCQHAEPSTPKRDLIKKPLNCKFIK